MIVINSVLNIYSLFSFKEFPISTKKKKKRICEFNVHDFPQAVDLGLDVNQSVAMEHGTASCNPTFIISNLIIIFFLNPQICTINSSVILNL